LKLARSCSLRALIVSGYCLAPSPPPSYHSSTRVASSCEPSQYSRYRQCWFAIGFGTTNDSESGVPWYHGTHLANLRPSTLLPMGAIVVWGDRCKLRVVIPRDARWNCFLRHETTYASRQVGYTCGTSGIGALETRRCDSVNAPCRGSMNVHARPEFTAPTPYPRSIWLAVSRPTEAAQPAPPPRRRSL
jgi:hypothetical protein